MSTQTEGQQKEEGPTDTYPLTWVRGFPLPEPFLNVAGVEKLMDFRPDDGDIFIVTYPKCGTTWTQFIVWEILNGGAVPPSPNQIMFHYVPFLEYADVDHLDHLSPPRAMKTHLPFHLQPYNPRAKYIYIARNPYDCCVSYFFHNKNDPSIPSLSFDRYFDLFLQGQVPWGDYLDHVLSWFPHRNDANVLFLTYEEMKSDVRAVVRKIGAFLGDEYRDALRDDAMLEKCVRHSDFKYLKQMGLYFPEHEGKDLGSEEAARMMGSLGQVDVRQGVPDGVREVPFFRKGETGDWRNHFSQSHLDKFNEYMDKKLRGTDMEGFWEPVKRVADEGGA